MTKHRLKYLTDVRQIGPVPEPLDKRLLVYLNRIIPMPERLPPPSDDRPLAAFELPPQLREFLQDRRHTCVMQSTDTLGTVFLIKAPGADIDSVRGRVPVHLRQELHDHPKAPVIRLVLTIYRQSDHPLPLDTFVNVEDPQQRADYAALAEQEKLHLLFYDEKGQLRLTKQIATPEGAVMGDVLTRAARLSALIDSAQFDFHAAKEAVLRHARL